MSEKPVKVKKTCPWCHGSGKPQGTPSTYEMLMGGVCGKCSGSGEVEELIWVEHASKPSSYSSTTSSDEGSGEAAIGCVFIVVILLLISLLEKVLKWLVSPDGVIVFAFLIAVIVSSIYFMITD